MQKSRLFLSLVLMLLAASCSQRNKASQAPTISTTELEDDAWHMEELYWEYVQNIDTVPYKILWHDDFIGYPSFGDGVSDASKIAS